MDVVTCGFKLLEYIGVRPSHAYISHEPKYMCHDREGYGEIYVYIFPNGKKYVGQTIHPRHRHREHFRAIRHPVDSAIKKYKDELTIISFTGIRREKLNDAERLLVIKLETFGGKGYNLTTGGYSGYQKPHSEETRDKIGYTKRKGMLQLTYNRWYPKIKFNGKRYCLSLGGYRSKEEAQNVIDEFIKSEKSIYERMEEKPKGDFNSGWVIGRGDRFYPKVMSNGREVVISGCCETREDAECILKKYKTHLESGKNLDTWEIMPGTNQKKGKTESKRVQARLLGTDVWKTFSSMSEASRVLKVWQANVSKVCKGILRQTGGHDFRYFPN